ncbi:hypothetical protein RCOM_1178400 [Ricinus communis]|uniref:Poly [ADP-ribose] polymerase n=1 Tax=Ricinus communis TaxID=3988 RepID=B9SAS7_RICCO|nr:hypothetical protein RCOM_1178400 [Ricinus communis]
MDEHLSANYDADKLPPGKLSTKGVGATAPDLSGSKTLEDGVIVPLGKPKEQKGSKIRMRYVVGVDFKYRK